MFSLLLLLLLGLTVACEALRLLLQVVTESDESTRDSETESVRRRNGSDRPGVCDRSAGEDDRVTDELTSLLCEMLCEMVEARLELSPPLCVASFDTLFVASFVTVAVCGSTERERERLGVGW